MNVVGVFLEGEADRRINLTLSLISPPSSVNIAHKEPPTTSTVTIAIEEQQKEKKQQHKRREVFRINIYSCLAMRYYYNTIRNIIPQVMTQLLWQRRSRDSANGKRDCEV